MQLQYNKGIKVLFYAIAIQQGAMYTFLFIQRGGGAMELIALWNAQKKIPVFYAPQEITLILHLRK